MGYAQFGEDMLIDRVFEHALGTAVDVGACDGVSISNTLHLEERGWRVLCIEANPAYEEALRKNRKEIMMCAVGAENADGVDFSIYEVQPGNFEAISALKPDIAEVISHRDRGFHIGPPRVVKVSVRTLDWCLEQAGIEGLDLASIDVEGGEAEVLSGFDLARWKPRMVILEDHGEASHRSRMCRAGYYLRWRSGVNDIFLRADWA